MEQYAHTIADILRHQESLRTLRHMRCLHRAKPGTTIKNTVLTVHPKAKSARVIIAIAIAVVAWALALDFACSI